MINPYQDSSNQLRLKQQISNYYRLQSRIYDSTRWSFLFGRRSLINEISRQVDNPKLITEFGSGTGHNLWQLAQRFPAAKLTGIDLSPEMLEICQRRTHPFNARIKLANDMDFSCLQYKQDLILFSYCLSMINPGWQNIMVQALSSLKPDGRIAVVDFHTSPHSLYRHFMRINHVSLSAEIYPFLQEHTNSIHEKKHDAYQGIWSYFTYIGVNK